MPRTGGARIREIWRCMLMRCENEHCTTYARYGHYGIKVCPEWHDFETFKQWAISHGYADDLTIDRIDPDGNYEPDNCRWITASENSRRARYFIPGRERKQEPARIDGYDGEVERISIVIPKESRAEIKTIAHLRGMTMHTLLNEAIAEKIAQYSELL